MTYEELDSRLTAIKNELLSLTSTVLDWTQDANSSEEAWQDTRIYNHLIRAGNELYLAKNIAHELSLPFCPDK